MNECWLKLYSAETWHDKEKWDRFIILTEQILGAQLNRLDDKDPARRPAGGTNMHYGDFICKFDDAVDARWVFGGFGKAKVDLAIHHHTKPWLRDDRFPNSLSVFFLCDSVDAFSKVEKVLGIAVDIFNPFYTYADVKEEIVIKKKSGAINLGEELIGVFWLTYFNNDYARILGLFDKGLNQEVLVKPKGGLLRLADRPDMVPSGMRSSIEKILGKEYFVDVEK